MDIKEIEYINTQLIDNYGVDTVTGRPIFRVVWADDQREKRMTSTLDSGIQLLYPEVREVPKYPYIAHLYVLERLSIAPEINQDELPVSKLSYEPLWCFCHPDRSYIDPTWPATKFVVDTVYAALGKKSMAKYKDDEKNTTEEGRQQRIDELQEELFGDESGLEGKTHLTKEAVVVPNKQKES